jgi:hypothetical protein
VVIALAVLAASVGSLLAAVAPAAAPAGASEAQCRNYRGSDNRGPRRRRRPLRDLRDDRAVQRIAAGDDVPDPPDFVKKWDAAAAAAAEVREGYLLEPDACTLDTMAAASNLGG